MSPHPRDFTDDVIEAMAETPNVMPHLHMPLQSGSDAILQTMRRSYRTDKYLGILDRVRQAMPHAMITTDIIVGFPGETEEDFQGTKYPKMWWASDIHVYTNTNRRFHSQSMKKQ
jgi:tRNA-2-methylthio-N6-dimethylallyladenosine synthase